MGKILITGGAGFIGSMVNKVLNAAGHETVVLDNLSRGDLSTVIAGTFVQGDMGDPKLLDEVFKKHKITAVMHFAALTDVGESVRHPEKYYANNVGKTLILLDKMHEHGVKIFIFSSSAAVYGNPEKLPITEETPTEPINPYGKTKLIIEQSLRELNINYVCLRYFNATGGDPDQEIKVTKLHQMNLIPLLFRHITEGQDKPFVINGDDYETRDGTCVRDYIHIDDLATAHIKAMQYLEEGGQSTAFNLGNGNGFTVKEVISTVEAVTGRNINKSVGPRREGDPAILIADATKAKTTLDWKPKYGDLGTIIRHAWRAYYVDKIAKETVL